MNLLSLQRDFRSWLTTEAADAASRLEPGEAPGLSVYLNNYRGSLMACLGESFATTRAWLGDEAFESAAAHHIDRLPPHSWTLDAYAVDFPGSLESRYPGDPEVGELARLELALGTAFVMADAAPLDASSLADVDWDAAVLRFIPSLEILDADTNAGAIWSAITAGEQPPAAQRLLEAASVAVWRSGFTPSFRTLDEQEAAALNLMMTGMSFGGLCGSLVNLHGNEEGSAVAGALLGRWLQDGMIADVSSAAHRP